MADQNISICFIRMNIGAQGLSRSLVTSIRLNFAEFKAEMPFF